MAHCYLCDVVLNPENESDEHIVLNCIGGRLSSKQLLCKKCNSGFGEEADAELCKALEPFSVFFDVRRKRGSPPGFVADEKTTGSKIKIHAGGDMTLARPIIKEDELGNGQTNIKITAPTIEMAKQILHKYKKRKPNLDIDLLIKQAEDVTDKREHSLSFGLSVTNGVVRSVLKSALGYYLFVGGRRTWIEHLLNKVNKKDADVPVHFWNRDESVFPVAGKDAYHAIGLVGDPVQELLYCYVEYYSTLKFIVALNQSYHGEDIRYSYCFSVCKGSEINNVHNLLLTRSDLETFKGPMELPANLINDARRTMGVAIGRCMAERRLEGIVDKAMNKCIKKYSNEGYITREMIGELVDEVMKGIYPMIVAATRKRRDEENKG